MANQSYTLRGAGPLPAGMGNLLSPYTQRFSIRAVSMVCWGCSGKITPLSRQLPKGIAAFMLKYRLPSDETKPNKAIGPLQDTQQALKTVRQWATEWWIDPQEVGIMGFLAGI